MLTKFCERRERLDNVKKVSENILQKIDEEIEEEQKNDETTKEPDISDSILFEIPNYRVEPSDLKTKINKLNSDQKVIFDKIIKEIDHQQRHISQKCDCKSHLKPIRLFCSGGAGKKMSIVEFSY